MYIAPNTTIYILKDCPLDNTYDHTIFFTGKEAQTVYFQSLTKHTLTQQTYQRVNKSTMRVQIASEGLYDCNYLMFRNTAFGQKWFYAFIKSIEYINNKTSEITYEIDVLQTWFFDYHPDECFVEREHTYTDNIGDNTQPENVELGEYITNSQQLSGLSTGDAPGGTNGNIVVAATFDKDFNDTTFDRYNGLFSGVTFNIFYGDSRYSQAGTFLAEVAEKGKQDGVLAVFLCPWQLTNPDNSDANYYDNLVSKQYDSIDGYVPKNNKLFTYPYNFLYVTNMQGAGAAFPYEFFDSTYCQYRLILALSCNPSVVFVPKNYKGVNYNYDEKMTISGWPQLPYNIDSFKAWLAQSASSLDVQALSTGAAMGVALGSALTGGAALPLIGAATSFGTIGANVYQHSILPNQAKGGGGAVTMAAAKLLDFMIMKKSVKAEFAKIIDNYFTAYGYACNKVKVPNRNARTRWTYCKTRQATLTGSVPCDDMAKICEIYNRGITWWRNADDIGKYYLDNTPFQAHNAVNEV